MQIHLLPAHASGQEQRILVQGPEFCIGRDGTCDLCVTNMSVSRRHAVLMTYESKPVVRDLGSRNGTFVNGKIVRDECELRHNDTLRVGPLEYRVQILSADSGPLEDRDRYSAARIGQLEAPVPSSGATLGEETESNRPLQPRESSVRNCHSSVSNCQSELYR
jgi:pSer/pThr/pTyr-binding forkhead associated (FHA) protein